MPLSPGDKLGPYEILALIGAGGMGEVWKARDPRVGRDVAIKVSQEHFSERFEREAKAIGALNHPNICTLYDVGPNYLVMEYVEGAPLKGPLPLDQALKYAAQICDALDAAHKKGITHRDLKPANILVTKAGIKLLDFGLAKLGTSGVADKSPSEATLTMALTGKNEIMGTLYYMSPEQLQAQANGQEIDARSDIFSFGLVLYEMLTGKRAFDGSSAASVIAAILERPAPSIAEVAPPALDQVLQRCLEKDPENRWQSARDLKAGLEMAGLKPGSQAEARPTRTLWPAVAAIFAIVAVALGYVAYRRAPEEPRVVKFILPPPDKQQFTALEPPAVSPDGRHLAFVAGGSNPDQLWVRELDSLAARPLPGTDGAANVFWSPDSRFVVFFAGGKLKKVDLAGGPVFTLCDVQGGGAGGSWSGSRNVILFSQGNFSGLWEVPSTGGTAKQVTTPPYTPGDVGDESPSFLPDGRHFLYTKVKIGQSSINIADLDASSSSKDSRELLKVQATIASAGNAVYVPPGYLLYQRERTLMAQPFDADKGRFTGDPLPVTGQGSDLFSVSNNGVLVQTTGTSGGFQLTWFDRSGKPSGTIGTPAAMNWAAISPDGSKVAHDAVDSQGRTVDVWVYDLARGTESRFTFGTLVNDLPVWSPDGSRIAYRSNSSGHLGVFQKPLNGAPEELLDDRSDNQRADDWSRDGRYIIEEASDPKTNHDIWVLPITDGKAGKPFPYLQNPFNEAYGKLSPNGKWLAYTSDETNRNEVYVQDFAVSPDGKPAVGRAKWQISTAGGSRPVWSRDGKELFFIGTDQKMMAVEIRPGPKFDPGTPKPLFDTRIAGSIDYWFDVSKGGRFLMPVRPEQATSEPMTVVVNWLAGLKK
jgi:eukaryotic-like serine/threonine-protein kinase